MATTCKLIGKVVLASSASSISLTSIPATYDDLLVLCSLRETATGAAQGFATIDINSSAATGRMLYGLAGSAASVTTTTANVRTTVADATANTFASASIYFPNYRGSTNKSFSVDAVTEDNSANGPIIWALAGLWSNTAAITSIGFTASSGGSPAFATNSSVYLYGITKA